MPETGKFRGVQHLMPRPHVTAPRNNRSLNFFLLPKCRLADDKPVTLAQSKHAERAADVLQQLFGARLSWRYGNKPYRRNKPRLGDFCFDKPRLRMRFCAAGRRREVGDACRHYCGTRALPIGARRSYADLYRNRLTHRQFCHLPQHACQQIQFLYVLIRPDGIVKRIGKRQLSDCVRQREKVGCPVGNRRQQHLGILRGQLAFEVRLLFWRRADKKMDARVNRYNLKAEKFRPVPGAEQICENPPAAAACRESGKHLFHGRHRLFGFPGVFDFQKYKGSIHGFILSHCFRENSNSAFHDCDALCAIAR